MIRTVVLVSVLALLPGAAWGQGFNDVLGAHDMTPIGKSPVKGRVSGSPRTRPKAGSAAAATTPLPQGNKCMMASRGPLT
ncbi:MAG TPA: hypothetical protein VLL05_07430, partial [Terriglobales bacterium]|nr:hypothetical protein [Terriglobales bacterium]